MLSLHFTTPAQEVVFADPERQFDIAADLEDDYSSARTLSTNDIRVAYTSKVSISYDIAKLDDQTAAEFMQQLKFFLDDPEMLLL